ncbi:type II toxin -antitoxin system TacA 1-like antitoxin [Actinomadura roseirufa]|uniref:type II toxin -antitoxin system TacA 1-like antitoxin n=1 Tax=Actinomadura roseirufa TaxID=2094049 RepID=UPI001041376D|nr:DUF1778 domain-containing protein [Actinomadura roseirufa]
MPESVRQGLPADDHIVLRTSPEQHRALLRAADLIGWTLHDYVLSAALDRAERDLHEHAASQEPPPPEPQTPEPFVAVIAALT